MIIGLYNMTEGLSLISMLSRKFLFEVNFKVLLQAFVTPRCIIRYGGATRAKESQAE